jgi:hypothetical protein
MQHIARLATLFLVLSLLPACNEGMLAVGHVTTLGLSCAMLFATLNMDKMRR